LPDTNLTESDPAIHRQREQTFVQHVERLLQDDRLRIDTTLGRRPITMFIRDVARSDKSVDLKRLMSEMSMPDRELQNRMPVGQTLDVNLSQKRFWFLKALVGRVRVVCVSPTRALLRGDEPQAMTPTEVNKLLSQLPPTPQGVPTTVALLSTSGFTLEAHELAERRADRTVLLIEQNSGGGWTVTGPVETKALSDLFDPENEEEKRSRVRDLIEENKGELLGGGIAADRICAKTHLPAGVVEGELKNYAKNTPGLVAKRLDGRIVLFREGTMPPPAAASAGGSVMPLIDRVKSLFNRKGESEKKIAFLSESRALLSQQRDRAYDELGTLEQQESQLKDQFKNAGSDLGKRRITSQLLQLRKDMERRQQRVTMLNQQVNVVSTHLHNLELVQQGQVAHLPNPEAMADDAVKAEEMLATLQANLEMADSVGSVGLSGMSDEEKALMEELEQETGGATKAKTETPATNAPASTTKVSAASRESGEPASPTRQRGAAEPG